MILGLANEFCLLFLLLLLEADSSSQIKSEAVNYDQDTYENESAADVNTKPFFSLNFVLFC